ncbi:phosphotransferase family protein [Actinoplanes sp. NBC_00393]|uniref:phosphotransferase family protein n=1 Tax=Actinoplanes sp. NBC_00393 TaxID=2975953 RepID=UPI002E20F8EB
MTGPRPVRAEDAFDVAAVARWLGLDAVPEVKQFTGGASNLTYQLGDDLILRRPPAGTKAAGAHDMGREYRIQSALAPVFAYVPEMVAYCEDESVIGSPFYVMRRVAGFIPRKNLDLPPDQVRQLCTGVLDLLADLHSVDPEAAGLADLGKGAGYVSRQVDGWSRRYRAARTRNVGSFEKVMAWLRDNQPEDRGICLIHNDFRLDNVVFDPSMKPVALLDWEMATLGDPLMDLGGALAYWVQADDGPLFRAFRRQPTHTPGMLTRREVVDYYCARRGFELTDREWAFYEVFGLFRLAVIVQQIYYRYHHRQTTNPAFRYYWVACLMLEARCRRIIRRAGR